MSDTSDPDAILAALEFEPDEADTTAEDVTKLHPAILSERFNAVRDELIELDEMHGEPKTDRGRELHSLRAAYLIEMNRRHPR